MSTAVIVVCLVAFFLIAIPIAAHVIRHEVEWVEQYDERTRSRNNQAITGVCIILLCLLAIGAFLGVLMGVIG